MRKSKIGTVISLIFLLCALLLLQSCGCNHKYKDGSNICRKCEYVCSHPEIDDKRVCLDCKNPKPSEGLEFSSNGDGTCSLVGLGTCMDTHIVVPSISPDGAIVSYVASEAFNYLIPELNNYITSRAISIVIPETLTNINILAFRACSKLKAIEVNENNPAYKSIDGVLYTKDGKTLLKYPQEKSNTHFDIPDGVELIGMDAFEKNHNLESIIIPNSVKTIEDSFSECSNLTSITIPTSVTHIDFFAFYKCDKLIRTENGIKYIDNWVVGADLSIETANIKTGTFGICEYAFSQCTELKSVVIPSGLEIIELLAFNGCKSLTTINIPASLINIEEGAFSACTALTDIVVENDNPNYKTLDGSLYTKDSKILLYYIGAKTITHYAIPNGVEKIGKCAFSGYDNLEGVTIPESVTEIAYAAFHSCKNLTDVTIPSNVNRIGSSAFLGCENLKTVSIPKGVTTLYNHTFYGCTNLANVVIPQTITTIESMAFYNCSSLETLIIPEGVKEIQSNAVENCQKLKKLTLPSSLKIVEKSAFTNCPNLRIYCILKESPVGWDYYWRDSNIPVHWDYKTN